MAQGNEPLVEVPDGIVIGHRGLYVDLVLVAGGLDPRLAYGEACGVACRPLHRRARVVARLQRQQFQSVGRREALALREVAVGIQRLHVHVLVDAGEVSVGHADLLALVHVRGALHQVQADAEHLGALLAPLGRLVAEAADCAGLVVVRPIEAVPAAARSHLVLPLGHDTLEVGQVDAGLGVFAVLVVVQVHVVEVEDHVQLAAVRAHVVHGLVGTRVRRLAHGHDVVVREDLALHLLQVLVHVRAGGATGVVAAVGLVLDHGAVGQLRVLGDEGDDVHAEAVDALVQPEAHLVVDRAAHGGVVPVEVALLGGEAVQVVLTHALHVGPCRAAEAGAPVVGDLVSPDVVVVVGVASALAGFLEPNVLVGGVVDHQVEDDLEPLLVRLGQKRVEVGHRAQRGLNGAVVGDVVAVVHLRGGEDRVQPDDVHAQLGQVVEFLADAVEVADAVAVGVAEALGVGLVNDG